MSLLCLFVILGTVGHKAQMEAQVRATERRLAAEYAEVEKEYAQLLKENEAENVKLYNENLKLHRDYQRDLEKLGRQ